MEEKLDEDGDQYFEQQPNNSPIIIDNNENNLKTDTEIENSDDFLIPSKKIHFNDTNMEPEVLNIEKSKEQIKSELLHQIGKPEPSKSCLLY